MKIKAGLSIGYATASRETIFDIPDEELEGLTEEEINETIDEYVATWSNDYIETWWEKA